MVAKALITQPKLAILDEPTVGIDVTQRDKMYEYIDKLNKEKNIAILLTTHYMEEAERLCERVIVIHGGKIVADGSKHEIIGKFKVKELIFEFDYKGNEDDVREKIQKIFADNKIIEYKFSFNNLAVFYNDLDLEFDELYELVRSSGVKIKDLKNLEGSLELAFKKIIEN